MFESEVNRKVERQAALPAEVIRKFAEGQSGIVARTLLPFGEHCTECAIPDCYSTCKMYRPRIDTRCSRFFDGMVRVPGVKSLNGYLVKVSFKKWAQLWTLGDMRLFSVKEARAREAADRRIAALMLALPLPRFLRARLTFARYDQKKYVYKSKRPAGAAPDYFLLECYNPQNYPLTLSLAIGPLDKGKGKIPFQKLIEVRPGFNRAKVPVSEIGAFVDLNDPFSFSIVPNEIPSGAVLYFGAWDFVKDSSFVPAEPGISKCVVWDLDNTIWDGILAEDGMENIKLKPGVVEVIKKLDERGILHSIASKNDKAAALKALDNFKISDYFLYPQISWMPKSEGVRRIARLLNLGLDTLIFIDDSEFERAEVSSRCAGVKVMDAVEYEALAKISEGMAAVSEETKSRRRMYRAKIVRESAQTDFGDDYFAFLRDCRIELAVKSMAPENLQRIYELAQRTNQMNFSGNRYSIPELRDILADERLDKYVIACKDRFGSYGVIGFGIVASSGPTLMDLMFSCRVINKRIEHAFLSYLLEKYAREGRQDFCARYRKTKRNAVVGKVFKDLGFEETGARDGVLELIFPKTKPVPEDGIVKLNAE